MAKPGDPCERLTSGRARADDGLWVGRCLLQRYWSRASPAASAQALSTLHITVTLADATGKITPVARHALLISDEPPITAPRRILTTLAGTADVSCAPVVMPWIRSAGDVRRQELRMGAAR